MFSVNYIKENSSFVILCGITIALFLSVITCNYYTVHCILLVLCLIQVLKGGISMLYTFTLFSFFQNIFLVVLSPTLTSWDTKLMILYKELIVYMSVILYLVWYQFELESRILKSILFFMAVIFLFNMIRPGAPFSLKLVSIRQLLLPFMCVYFGYSIITSKKKLRDYMSFYINCLCVLGIIGLIMYQFEPKILWDSLNYPQYFWNKNEAPYETEYVNFYSWDFGPKLKRFVSIIADPIAVAHMIGIALVYLLIVEKKRMIWKLSLMFICAIFCVSKSLIFLFCTMGIVLFYLHIKKRIYKILFFCISFLAIFVLFTLATLYVNSLESNTASGNHLKSVIFAVYNNSLLGDGLGSAGYLAGVMTGNSAEMDANESFMAVIITQLGLIGTFAFYIYFIFKIVKFVKLYYQTKSRMVVFGLILLTDIILESIVSGSSISMMGTGLYFILSGTIYSNYNYYLKFSKDYIIKSKV